MSEVILQVEQKRRFQRRPWMEHKGKPEIPFEWRTFALSLSTGRVVPLTEEWKPDEQTGKLMKTPDSLDNNDGYPTMDFDEAEELFAYAEENDEALTISYAKLFGRERMTLGQIGALAHLPKFYATPEKKEAARKRIKRKEDEDEMIKAAGIEIPDVLKEEKNLAARKSKAVPSVLKGGGDVVAALPDGVMIRGKKVNQYENQLGVKSAPGAGGLNLGGMGVEA